MARTVQPEQSTSALPEQKKRRGHSKPERAGGGRKRIRDGEAPADLKGKGKTRLHEDDDEPVFWKDKTALVLHSFTLHRLGPLHELPVSATALAESLRLFLVRQLALDDTTLGPHPITRVQAGRVDCTLHGPQHATRVPLLIEVDRTPDDDNAPTTTSTFVLLPASPASPHAFAVLLARSTPTALTASIITFLSTRFDTLVTPLCLPSSALVSLLESLLGSRDPDASTPTSLTFAFPQSLATEGLSSLTLTLPPPLVDALAPLEDDAPNFVRALDAHVHALTALRLADLQLLRMGGGRGTFIHSGHGGAPGDGAKIKFYRAAADERELESTLAMIVEVAEKGRQGALKDC